MRKNLFSFLVLVLSAAAAVADFAEVPLEVLVDEADLIVVGKVTKIQHGGFGIGQRKYDVAVLEVSNVLKSSGKPKEVHVAQPDMKIIRSDDIRFRPGQQGIWLLTKDPERNVNWAKHPSQFQPEKEAKKIVDLVEARSKLPGGKATAGLVARAELLETPGNFKVRFSLKNVNEKPITVCEYVGHRPVQVKWIGPDGNALNSRHYEWLARAFIGPLSKNDFAIIQPVGVRFISQNIVFRPGEKPTQDVNMAQAGQHKITVGFAAKEDGKQFGLENVWTGTVTANEVTFTVK